MKTFILIIALSLTSSLYTNAQTRVVVRPSRKVVVVHRPVIAPVRTVVLRPQVTVVRPIVRRRMVIVHH